jgi:L-asparaginase
MTMKKILYLSTGGTVSSTHGSAGITPTVDARSMLEMIPSVKKMCRIEASSIMNIDSTNMQPEDWSTISRAVFEGLGDFDGIVISHGTHTMAYTASALSFMIRNVNRPVVLTGAQIPIDEEWTDGKRNLTDAFVAASEPIAGVFVVFNGWISRGCRITKLRTRHTDAFASVNAPPIGAVWGETVRYFQEPPAATGMRPELHPGVCPDVFLIKVFPGMNPAVLDAILQTGVRGVVIEGYGVGSIPFMKRDLLPGVRQLLRHGVSTVITTQSLFDGTDFSMYEVGKTCLALGAIPGLDMTTEAIVAKLMWALGQTEDIDEVRKIMTHDYAGELTGVL